MFSSSCFNYKALHTSVHSHVYILSLSRPASASAPKCGCSITRVNMLSVGVGLRQLKASGEQMSDGLLRAGNQTFSIHCYYWIPLRRESTGVLHYSPNEEVLRMGTQEIVFVQGTKWKKPSYFDSGRRNSETPQSTKWDLICDPNSSGWSCGRHAWVIFVMQKQGWLTRHSIKKITC